METYTIQVQGPYELLGDKSIFYLLKSDRAFGVYLFTIPYENGYLVHYVGESGRPFVVRLEDHIRNQWAGLYCVYEPNDFAKGKRTTLWEGHWKEKKYKEPTRVLEFMKDFDRYQRASNEVQKMFRIFLLPTDADTRIRLRLETGIAMHLYAQEGEVGKFQDEYLKIKYLREGTRRENEEKVEVLIKSGEHIRKLPDRLVV